MKQRRDRKMMEQEGIHLEVSELRRAVEQQSAQLAAITAQIELLLTKDASRKPLADEESILSRGDEVQARVYDLQLATAVRLANGDAPRQIAYQQVIRRIREVIRTVVPRDATVIVVSKGDDELLNLYGRKAWHFPRTDQGTYAGHYPPNSTAAIIHLEVLRARGGDYLLFPETALWWLDHPQYSGLSQHLEQRYEAVVRQKDTCVIFALREPAVWARFGEAIAECRLRLAHEPAILDWNTGLGLAASFPSCTIFSPPAADGVLPYLDRSIDLVAMASDDPAVRAEAERVAAEAVLEFPSKEAGQDGLGNPVSLSINWLSEQKASVLPSTSIIIPVHNGLAYTEICLRSLRETLPHGFSGEIIIVDDASTDETPTRLKQWAKAEERLKIVRNPKNLGFLESVNRGAKKARGEVLLFLNNDTVPLPGWLPPLLRVLRDFPDAGAIGGKLVFPDGTLQEAGGIIFCDGSAAHFGRGEQDTDAPLYNYVREVDYCSGALLATRRTLFEELGGFDIYFRPAYYEDTDYCFRVREKGMRVYYQPESVVAHLEGASSGNDLTRGMKRYQVVNYDKFVERWREVLKRQPLRPPYGDVAAWKALAVRGHASERMSR